MIEAATLLSIVDSPVPFEWVVAVVGALGSAIVYLERDRKRAWAQAHANTERMLAFLEKRAGDED